MPELLSIEDIVKMRNRIAGLEKENLELFKQVADLMLKNEKQAHEIARLKRRR
jgi:hypothetical protein